METLKKVIRKLDKLSHPGEIFTYIKPVTRYAGPTEIDQVYYVNSNEDDEIRGSAGAAIRRRDVNELFYPAHGGQLPALRSFLSGTLK